MLPATFIDEFTEKFRGSASLAVWLGVDVNGDVRFYYAETSPPMEVIFADVKAVGTSSVPLRYAMWRSLPEGEPEWFTDGSRIETYTVEAAAIDKSDGSAGPLAVGYDEMRKVFEPPLNQKWQDIQIHNGRVMQVRRVAGEGPEKDPTDEWYGAMTWEILIEFKPET